jgi:CubicO group peptidase (beta-lactamase class C family)
MTGEPAANATIDPRTVDRLARAVLKATRAPGMSVAVVAGEAVYTQGYGVRERGKPDP